MSFDHSFVNPRPRGPYGTNIGDTWFAADWMQEKIREDKGPKWAVCIVVNPDKESGRPTEAIFVTENEELIEEARQGTIAWARAQAERN